MTPTTPKTYVVTVNPGASEGYTKEPIIGFIYDGDTPVKPITINGANLLTKGSAVMFFCGMVSDPNTGLSFGTVEEWLDSAPTTSKAPAKHTEKAAPKRTPAQERDEEEMGDEDGPAYDIEWTDKTYKTNSFWHYDDGEYEFVYQVDGGEEVPKQTSKNTKIKGTELAELKKRIDKLSVEEIMSADPLPEPEIDDEDDDDEDGEDLI